MSNDAAQTPASDAPQQDATTTPAQATEQQSDGKDQLSADLLQVKVHSPFKVYFDGDAKSISAINGTGPFDILPKHHNFITLLSPCDVIIRGVNEEKRIRIARGVMHVRSNKVSVFLDV